MEDSTPSDFELPDPRDLPRGQKPAKNRPQCSKVAEQREQLRRLSIANKAQVGRFAEIEGLRPPSNLPKAGSKDWADRQHAARLLSIVLRWAAQYWPSISREDREIFLREIAMHEPLARLLLVADQLPADARAAIDAIASPYVERIDAGANKTAVAHATNDLPASKEQK